MPDDTVECFRMFQQPPCSIARLRLESSADLATALGAVKLSPPRYSSYVLTTPDQRTAALRLWRELTGYEPIDYDDAFHREGTFDSLGLRERTAALVLFGSKAVLEKRDSVKKSLVDDFSKTVTEQLRAMRTHVEDQAEPGSPRIDDPAMVWRRLEAAFGIRESSLMIHLCQRLLEWPLVDDDIKAGLCDALGNCGYPSFAGDGSIFDDVRKNVFHDATLRSRWQWLGEPRHVAACLDQLATAMPGSETAAAATETLVRLDALPRIPGAVLERWYADRVVQDTASQRRHSLTVLSLQPTGRRYLVERLKSEADSATIREAITAMLAARAVATLATGRFDFMSEERCRELLALSEAHRTRRELESKPELKDDRPEP
jgi:hypothetical protein